MNSGQSLRPNPSPILRVSDGRGGVDLQAFQVSVSDNHVPVITSDPSVQAAAGFAYEYQVSALDADGDTIEYRLDQAPSGVTLDAMTGLLEWSTAILGTHAIAVSALDNQGGETSQSYDLLVANLANDPPEITSTPRTRIQLGQNYLYDIQTFDRNGDPITLFLDQAPDGMELTDGILVWTPTSAQFGTLHPISIRIEDGRGGSDTQDFSVEVVDQFVNTAPVINSNPVFAARLGQPYVYDAVATDADNDLLVWQLSDRPNGMSINPSSGQIRWTPENGQLGPHSVIVDVLDGQGGSAQQSFTVTVRSINTPPLITSVPPTLGSVGTPIQYQVQASDVDGDVLQYLKAGPANMSIDSATGLLQWTPDGTQIGTHTIGILVGDGQASAEQTFDIVIELAEPNQPPAITSIPGFRATIDEQYQYDVDAVDPNGQIPSYQLLEFPTGMEIVSSSGLITWTPTALGTVTVSVAANDSFGAGAIQRYDLTVLATNNAPVILSPPIEGVATGGTYRYDVRANDVDGDPLVYSLVGEPAGMTIDPQLGRIRWSPQLTDEGTHPFDVHVSDGRGGLAIQPVNLSVGPDSQPPQVQITVDQNPIDLGQSVTIIVTAVDDVGVVSRSLSIEGVVIPLDSNGRATVLADTVGLRSIVATASDPSGNVGQATSDLLVSDPNDVDAPIVSITSPGDGEQITGPIDVIGTVTDDTLVSYTLSYAPLEAGQFIELATGSTEVVDGVLGQFDPTLLTNDTYILQLFAEDAGGKTSVEQILVEVTGSLKIGNFTLSFTDLTVPVSGIPITIARTYDSLNTATQSDFGFGWRMEFKDTDLRTSVQKSGLEEEGFYNPFYNGARVYVTLPGGNREGFTFQLTPTPGRAGAILGIFNGVFVPDDDVDSTLTANGVGDSFRVTEFGEALLYTTGTPWNPLSPLFGGTMTVTTREGIRYTIEGDSGDLQEVADRNGNTLTFTDAGVFSSSGQSVTLERDPQGRISAVIDPAGNRVEYAYDAAGDLVAVRDREQNETTFVYDEPSPPHFLTEIRDPLGRTGIRSEYDDQGRLINMIDAGGHAIELIHDPNNFVETVKNQLGNPTTFEYDGLGNVLTEIDAEGGVTTYAYDDLDNRLNETSITDSLGNTTFFEYDADGNLIGETDPLGNVTRSTYDSFGNILTSTDPLGNTSVNAYDSRGNLLSIIDAGGMVTSFTYDASGNPLSFELPGGNTQGFVYDGGGNVLEQTDALGSVTTFTYDSICRQLTETRTQTTPTGMRTIVTESEYDDEGRIRFSRLYEDGVLRRETETLFDAVGNRVESIDGLGRSTTFVYDDRGLLTETVLPDDTPANDTDNPRTLTEYDAAGQTVATIDQLGRRIESRYDKAGRQTETIFPDATPGDLADNPRTSTEYDAAGRVIAQIDERGNRAEFVFNGLGQQVEVILPDSTPSDLTDNPRVLTAYDNAGRSVAQTDPLGHVTQFVYDDSGRPVETILHDGSSTQSVFDGAGRLAARIDQTGSTTQYEYDPLGRLVAVVLPEVDDPISGTRVQPRTEYEYDDLGNLVVQRDANGHETRFEYDGQGRRTATELPLGQRSTTTYDAVGVVNSTTDFNGDTIAFTYDVLGRLTLKDLPGTFPDVSYTYTLTGQLDTVTDGRGTTDFDYDERGRLVSRIDPDLSSIAYTYDAASNRTSVTTTVPSNAQRTTQYTFDEQNRTSTVTDPEGDVAEYSYDVAGRLIRTDLPNGTFEARTYDELNRLSLVESRNEATDEVLTSFAYELDEVGNRTSITEHDGRRVEYDYDELYRLIGEDIFDPGVTDPSRTIDYTYDIVSNRLTRDDSDEGVTSYTYDNNDRLLVETLAGAATNYEYDDNGNTTAKHTATDSVFYSWDPENRLIAADTDGDGTDDVTYQYDHEGMRVSKVVDGEETRFLLDKNRPYAQVLEEYTPGGIIKVSYVHGLDLISQNRAGEGKSFYHVDGLGSTRALTDITGAVTDTYIYDAFGRTIGQVGSTGNVYLFAGEQRDTALGLDYLRARYMDPSVGRFVGRDSFEGRLNDPVTLHKYLYANVNPVNVIDPSGQFSIISVNIAVSIVTGLAIGSLVFGAAATVGLIGEIKWSARLTVASAGIPLYAIPGLAAGGAIISATSEVVETSPGVFEQASGEWAVPLVGLSASLFPLGFTSSGGDLTTAKVFGLNRWVLSGWVFLVNADIPTDAFKGEAKTFAFVGVGTGDFSGTFQGFDIGLDAFIGFSIPIPGTFDVRRA